VVDENHRIDEVKTGNVKGFSLEGVFKNKQVFNNIKKMKEDGNMFIEFFNKMFQSQEQQAKKQDEHNQKMLQLQEQTQLAIIHNSTKQMLSGEAIVTNQSLNIGAGLSVSCNKFGQARQLDNNNFRFSEIKNGQYKTVDNQEFEIRDGIAYIKLSEEVEAEAVETETQAQETNLAAREIIIPDGEAIYVQDDGTVYRADNTIYPDGEYVDETGKTLIISKGKIVEVDMPENLTAQFSALQKQIKDLTLELSEVKKVLKTGTPAKDAKVELASEGQEGGGSYKMKIAERMQKQSKSRY
jgi:hypothetical protein